MTLRNYKKFRRVVAEPVDYFYKNMEARIKNY